MTRPAAWVCASYNDSFEASKALSHACFTCQEACFALEQAYFALEEAYFASEEACFASEEACFASEEACFFVRKAAFLQQNRHFCQHLPVSRPLSGIFTPNDRQAANPTVEDASSLFLLLTQNLYAPRTQTQERGRMPRLRRTRLRRDRSAKRRGTKGDSATEPRATESAQHAGR